MEPIGQKHTKFCSTCGTLFDELEGFFPKDKRGHEGYSGRCKSCNNTRNTIRRRGKVKRMFTYKGGRKCQECGLTSEWPIFDFHHLDPNEKEQNVTSMAGYTWDKIKEELDKCIILCANCHRIAHAKERKKTLDSLD